MVFLCVVTGIGAIAYFNGYGPQPADEEGVKDIQGVKPETKIVNTTQKMGDGRAASPQDKKMDNLLHTLKVESSNESVENNVANEADPLDLTTVEYEDFGTDEEIYTVNAEKLSEAGPIDGEIDFVGTSCDFDGAGIRLEGYVRNGTDAEFINQRIGLNVYTINAAGEEFLLADNEFILLEDTFGKLGAGEARHFSFRFGSNRVSNTAPDWSKGFRVEAELID